MVLDPAPRDATCSRRLDAACVNYPRPHAAQRRAGRRHALRWRRGDGAARGRPGLALRAHYGVDPLELRDAPAVIALAPGGRMLDEAYVQELAAEPALTLLCGRYEGFDERIVEHFASETLSIGRYVLAGGELRGDGRMRRRPAQAPGALGHAESARRGVLQRGARRAPEYPHYTRPAEYRGWRVPEVLLSGHHERIREWRPRAQPRTGRSARWSSRTLFRRHMCRPASRCAPVRRDRRDLPLPWRLRRSASRVRCDSQARRRRGPPSSHEHCHRKHRACAAAPRPQLRAGRPREGALPGDRGHPPAHPGLRGRRHQAPGPRSARDVHRAQAVLRRGRRAHVPGALAQDRAHRVGGPRATCAAPSSTTCAIGWASARVCASAATPAPRRRSSRACCTGPRRRRTRRA